jgi:lipopolysaccharide biosynthesis glycosyltransferase
MNKETIDVVCVSDNNYIQHLGVMTESLFYNNLDIHINLYLINIGIKNENLCMYKEMFNKYEQKLIIINRDNDIFKDFVAKNHITKAAYHKIMIPRIFDKLDKVLLLDCDMIINSKISELWNIDVSDYYLAAVQNISRLKYDDSFNSGVMLLNLKKMRDDFISEKMFDYLQLNSGYEKLHDQAGYNKIIGNKWRKIDLGWNLQSFVLMSKKKHIGYSKTVIKKSIKNPKIVHFSAKVKPWEYLDSSNYRKYYYIYLTNTPWKGFYPVSSGIKETLLRLILIIIPNFLYVLVVRIRNYFNNLIKRNGS